jgi:5-methylcytosine-specific restriction protein A
MPRRPKSVCRQPGCGLLIDGPGFCSAHIKVKQQEDTERRGTAHERGYTSAWTKARGHYLRKHPLCVYCERQGRVMPATVVDHIVAHGLKRAIDSGNAAAIARARVLFWDSASNWQSLCATCHDSTKQKEEAAARKGRGRI